MTVAELIEELKRQPNQKVPIAIAVVGPFGVVTRREADTVRFDGRSVVIEG